MIVGVIGMGYVGIPEAVLFANAPKIKKVYGFQRNSSTSGYKIDMLNKGELPFDEPGLQILLIRAIERKKFVCTEDFSKLLDCDAIIIAVQTPVDIRHKPDFTHLDEAVYHIKKYIKPYQLVILISTIPPGTTNKIKCELEKTGVPFYICHSPERITPGKIIENIHKYPRIIGGEPYHLVSQLYRNITNAEFIPMTAIEAEITKTGENAIRAVQIAMANQIAMICESTGANFYKVKEGIDSLKGVGITRAMLYPGAGVGGHCLTKDGYLLSTAMPNQEFTLFSNAIRINDNMPNHLWGLTEDALGFSGKVAKGSRILILGWSYLPNSSDIRHSPAIKFKQISEEMGCSVVVYDPICNLNELPDFSSIDAVVIITVHDEMYELVRELPYKYPSIIVDGRNVVDPMVFLSNGWIYRGVGRGDV